jgi:hypothetical protein
VPDPSHCWIEEDRTIGQCAVPPLGPNLFRRVIEQSLLHFLNGICPTCNGTGAKTAKEMFRHRDTCEGTRRAKLSGLSGYKAKLVGDMICELEAIDAAQAGRADSTAAPNK